MFPVSNGRTQDSSSFMTPPPATNSWVSNNPNPVPASEPKPSRFDFSTAKRKTKAFFGVADHGDPKEEDALKSQWLERRKRFSARKYGDLKDSYLPSPRKDTTDDVDLARRTLTSFGTHREAAGQVTDLRSGLPLSPPIPKPRKDSVARLTLSGISFIASTISKKKARERSKTSKGPVPKASGRGWSRSFARSYASAGGLSDDSVFESGSPSLPSRTATGTASTTPYEAPSPIPEGSREDVVDHTLAPIPDEVEEEELLALDDEVFFDRSFSDSADRRSLDIPDVSRQMRVHDRRKPESTSKGGWRRYEHSDDDYGFAYMSSPHGTQFRPLAGADPRTPAQVPSTTGAAGVGLRRVWRRAVDAVLDNSNRRQYGMGAVGKLLRHSIRKSVTHTSHVKAQLDDMDDYRPYFTYWVTIVQILITIIGLACYGFGPMGFTLAERRDLVKVTSLVKQSVDYWEPANFWIGPRAADLIHLGAKFAPCMRYDERINSEVERQRAEEKETACCIRNDHSGCVQTTRRGCSDTLSSWKKWSEENPGPNGRTSGTVCGQDPNFCGEPASVAPFEWADDITKWPICRQLVGTVKRPRYLSGHSDDSYSDDPSYPLTTALVARELQPADHHMTCEVIGRPCCIGIHGDCRIATREYCDFVKGYFHDEAALCSQVSCLNDVCGMIPFYNSDKPDQFYRLWTSLFLHAGILHLLITVGIQWYFMRDLEKMAGPLRIGIIYIMSGVMGNLASALFIPYRADVGPAGAQFGLLACMYVEVINSWPMLRNPHKALLKLGGVTAILFVIGLLPWVDNYSHFFGFLFGFLISYALLPFVSFGEFDRRWRVVLIVVCLLLACVIFTVLVILFYVSPFYECEVCKLLTCIPIIADFCADQNINFDKKPFWSV